MAYEVTPGQCLLHSGVKYPSGAIVPSGVEVDRLCAAGVIQLVEEKVVVRPEPEPQVRSTAVSDFDASDASSVTNVPLRLLPNVLKDINDSDLLIEMHSADSRKGGKDLIEERLGELEAEDA
jgi:hypothetical protein